VERGIRKERQNCHTPWYWLGRADIGCECNRPWLLKKSIFLKTAEISGIENVYPRRERRL